MNTPRISWPAARDAGHTQPILGGRGVPGHHAGQRHRLSETLRCRQDLSASGSSTHPMTGSSTCNSIGPSARSATPIRPSRLRFHRRGRGQPDGSRDGSRLYGSPDCTAPGYPAGASRRWPADGREGGVPDPATRGPAFIQIGTEGGFLPAAGRASQPAGCLELDPTMFNVGNVLQQNERRRHALPGSGGTGGRHRGLHQFCRPDPDPLQRRADGVSGPRPAI